MLIRTAFFEGDIRPGHEADFNACVNDVLKPMWLQFPGALGVEVLREIEADDGSRPYPLLLQVSYPNRAALDQALASPIRVASREPTQCLFDHFDGRIFLTICERLTD